LGLSFVAVPQAEAQGFLKYFGGSKSSHGHKSIVSKTLRKNVAELDQRSGELLTRTAKPSSRYGRSGNHYGKGHGRGLHSPVANFNTKVDSLVWATKNGNPRSIKSAANDAKYALDLVRSAAMRGNPQPEVRALIKQSSYVLSNIQTEASRLTPVVAVTRTPVRSNNHYNRRSFTPVPRVSTFASDTRNSSSAVTTTATINFNDRNTSTTTVATTPDRNTDRTNTATTNTRTGDRDNTDTRNNGGDRNQQGGGRGTR